MNPPTIQVPSGRRSPNFAMNRAPATKPTEVSPSCRPYSNSVAPTTLIAIGSNSTVQKPNDRRTGKVRKKAERRTGVDQRDRAPPFRFHSTPPIVVDAPDAMFALPPVRITTNDAKKVS